MLDYVLRITNFGSTHLTLTYGLDMQLSQDSIDVSAVMLMYLSI